MLVKLLKDTELKDRKYLAGETRDFNEAVALKLIADGNAEEPKPEKVLLDEDPEPAKLAPIVQSIKEHKTKKAK